MNVTIIAGATASGKSALALTLAAQKNGIIINADALQIYRDLPILSAQPGARDRAACLHALYGILDADQVCSAALWVQYAVDEIRRTWDAGLHPIVTGGTGLYLKTLVNGFSPIPNVPDDVRAASRVLQSEMGNPAFHAHLAAADPAMAARLKPGDTQRLIRAYEVITATGISLDEWQKKPAIPPLPQAQFHKILVDGPRDVLRGRALKRLGQMAEMGAISEALEFHRKIEAEIYAPDAPPTRALGYHAFVSYGLGEGSLENAITAAHHDTCQYIKRQQTWFRHQMSFDETVSVS